MARTTLELTDSTSLALTAVAASEDLTPNELAERILAHGLHALRQKQAQKRKAQWLEQHLPESLTGVELDHPIFKKTPREVAIRRTFTPQYS